MVELIIKVIRLIVKAFGDILSNKEKYYFLKEYKKETYEEDDCFNVLLFSMYLFLNRSLIREPVKSKFSSYMKEFLLNTIFPLIVTLEDENNFLKDDPEGYNYYIEDITNEYKMRTFRTSSCFFVFKICQKYEDTFFFVSSFCIEMLNNILNDVIINSELAEYNVYLKNINNTLMDKFDLKTKLDFALLIILIIKKYIKKSSILNNSLIKILINGQNKINMIHDPIIKIKFCKLYNYLLLNGFLNSNNICDENKFIENIANYMLNCIFQKGLPGENNIMAIYLLYHLKSLMQ